MYIFLFFISLIFHFGLDLGVTATSLIPQSLRVNYLLDSALQYTVIDDPTPEFMWTVGTNADPTTAAGRGLIQTSYELQVSTDPAFLNNFVCLVPTTPSNRTKLSCDLTNVTDLGIQVFWRVRIGGNDDATPSAWVASNFSTGITSSIGSSSNFMVTSTSLPPSVALRQPLRFRGVITDPSLSGQVVRAIAYIASPAYYSFHCNGKRIDSLKEYGAWTEFSVRIFYDAWDVTELFITSQKSGRSQQNLSSAPNSIVFGLRVGPGPYGHLSYAPMYNSTALPVLMEIHVDVAADPTHTNMNTTLSSLPQLPTRYIYRTSNAKCDNINDKSGSSNSTAATTSPSSSSSSSSLSSIPSASNYFHQIITVPEPITLHAHDDTLTYSDWYFGEIINNTNADVIFSGWDTPQYVETSEWVTTKPYQNNVISTTILSAHDYPHVSRYTILTPSQLYVNNVSTGTYTFAFDQNFPGYVELDVPVATASSSLKGVTISIDAGELLFPNNLTAYNQLAYGTNMGLSWTLCGNATYAPVETIAPAFVFWGFQFVTITGWPSPSILPPPTLSSMRGIETSTITPEATIGSLEFNGVIPSSDIAASFVQIPSVSEDGTAFLLEEKQEDESAFTTTTTRGGNQKKKWRNQRYEEEKEEEGDVLNATILAGTYHAIKYSQIANFQSQPSDCINREKRGWGSDSAVSAEQCVWTFDVSSGYRSWSRSHRDNQYLSSIADTQNGFVNGSISAIIPAISPPGVDSDASWGLVIAETVMQAYLQYGDDRYVKTSYDSIKSYVDFLTSQTDPVVHVMRNQSIWGDWDAYFDRLTYVDVTKEICATSSHMRMATWLYQIAAEVAGHPEDISKYHNLFSATAAPYNAYYSLNLANGTYGDGIEQTPAILPLMLNYVPTENIAQVVNWLINDIETTHNIHLTTGAGGTRFFFELLSGTSNPSLSLNRLDLAAQVAAQSTIPSHGYWVTQGGTTCWENWSGVPGADHPPYPTHNHIFLGSHAPWMYKSLLGISQVGNGVINQKKKKQQRNGGGVSSSSSSAGFDEIVLSPPILDTLPAMRGSVNTVTKGLIALSWIWTGETGLSTMNINVTLPPNTLVEYSESSSSAMLRYPVAGVGAMNTVIREGPVGMQNATLIWDKGTFYPQSRSIVSAAISSDGLYIEFGIGSGSYQFEATQSSVSSTEGSAAAGGRSTTTNHHNGDETHNKPEVLRACLPFPGKTAAMKFMALNLTCAHSDSIIDRISRAGIISTRSSSSTTTTTSITSSLSSRVMTVEDQKKRNDDQLQLLRASAAEDFLHLRKVSKEVVVIHQDSTIGNTTSLLRTTTTTNININHRYLVTNAIEGMCTRTGAICERSWKDLEMQVHPVRMEINEGDLLCVVATCVPRGGW